jgi:nicotinamidase-related amidase
MNVSRRALILIDLQNDYFDGGRFPLWNAEETLGNVERAIELAKAQGVPVILVQHVVRGSNGAAPFFNEGTEGAEIHPRIRAALPTAPVIVKEHADAFFMTSLEDLLQRMRVDELLVCGMMTQNCVTHTAISKSAEMYNVTILSDCCTTVSEILHKIALRAVSTRVTLGQAASMLREEPKEA